jgi:hypothetical protein
VDSAALAQVAGAKEVLFDELSINDLDAKKDLVLKREGAIQDPRTEIMARLNATPGVEQNKPTLMPDTANRASWLATAKSHMLTNWHPAAVAMPCTCAITG